MSLFGNKGRGGKGATAQVNYKSELFVATNGQTVFTLTKGIYTPGSGLIRVYVDGILQVNGDNFTETSSNSFTLSEGVVAGVDVFCEWYETLASGHKGTHAKGQADEIDVTALKNYDEEVSSKIGILNKKITGTINILEYENYKTSVSGGFDWSVALQKIIDDSVGKVKIKIPQGDYMWKNVSLKSDVYIVIDEHANIKALPGTNAADHFFKITGTSGAPIKNVRILNGNFDALSLMGSVLSVTYGENVRCKDIEAVNLKNNVVHAISSKRVKVIDCSVDGCVYGVTFEKSEDCTVDRGYYKNSTRDGILSYSGSKNTKVIGVTVENYTLGLETGRAGIHVYGSSDAVISSNIVLSGSADTEGIRFRDANNFTCVGNKVTDPGASGIAVVRIGDYAGLDGGYGTINGNTVINPKLRGISVPYTASKPVTVIGNTIVNTTSPSTIDPAVGILVNNPFSIVQGNVIDGSQGNGISIGGNDINASDNTIRNVGTGTVGSRAGIHIQGTGIICNGNIIKDEQTTKTMVDGIRIYAGATASLSRNQILGWTNSKLRLDGTLLDGNKGQVIIATSTNRITVTHKLSASPSIINTSAKGNLGSLWIENVNTTTFDIVCSTAPTSGTLVYWSADI